MHKRQVRNQRHFIQPLTCYGSVLNVLLKIPQHEANHKFTFTGQSEKKKKKGKKKNPQRRNAEPEVLVPYRLEIELSCRLNAFKFSSYS